MKKNLVSSIIFSALGLASASSFAAQDAAVQGGTITFAGALTDATCQLSGTTPDQTVTLPTVAASGLATAGKTNGSTSFSIAVENCPAAVTKISAHFEAKVNMDPVTKNLKQTATGDTAAKNVQIQLLNVGDGSVIPVGTRGASFDVTGTGATRGATMTYAGQYYATGTATVGAVASSTQYTVAYN
jgi:major type 1 subunit fimbrin (pilin)